MIYNTLYKCAVSLLHHNDVTMGAIAPQITSLTIIYSTVYSDANQGKHRSSASLTLVWGIHRWPVNSPLKGPVTRKMVPFDDVIMVSDELTDFVYLLISAKKEIEREEGAEATSLLQDKHYHYTLLDMFFGEFRDNCGDFGVRRKSLGHA